MLDFSIRCILTMTAWLIRSMGVIRSWKLLFTPDCIRRYVKAENVAAFPTKPWLAADALGCAWWSYINPVWHEQQKCAQFVLGSILVFGMVLATKRFCRAAVTTPLNRCNTCICCDVGGGFFRRSLTISFKLRYCNRTFIAALSRNYLSAVVVVYALMAAISISWCSEGNHLW